MKRILALTMVLCLIVSLSTITSAKERNSKTIGELVAETVENMQPEIKEEYNEAKKQMNEDINFGKDIELDLSLGETTKRIVVSDMQLMETFTDGKVKMRPIDVVVATNEIGYDDVGNMIYEKIAFVTVELADESEKALTFGTIDAHATSGTYDHELVWDGSLSVQFFVRAQFTTTQISNHTWTAPTYSGVKIVQVSDPTVDVVYARTESSVGPVVYYNGSYRTDKSFSQYHWYPNTGVVYSVYCGGSGGYYYTNLNDPNFISFKGTLRIDRGSSTWYVSSNYVMN